MDTREWWQKIQHTSTIFDFKWSPVSSKINFDFLGKCGERSIVNHFDGHQCLTNKDQLLHCVQKACEATKQNVFDFTPLTFVLNNSDKAAQDGQFDKFCHFFNAIEKNKAKEVT